MALPPLPTGVDGIALQQLSIFVRDSDSYLGRSITAALVAAGHHVYAVGTRVPGVEKIGSVDDAWAICNAYIFDIRSDPSAADSALSVLEAVTTKVKLMFISTILTWASTPSPSGQPFTGDDFRKRKPHPAYRATYETEVRASRLARTNWNIDLNVVTCGIVYGDGEGDLRDLFIHAWKVNGTVPILGSGENLVPMMHVRDVGQLVVTTFRGEMVDRYVMAQDHGAHRFREVAEAIARVLTCGRVRRSDPDSLLTHPWATPGLIALLTVDISVVNELLARVKTTYTAGFVAAIETVKSEFVAAHGVSPHRILICGPPLTGKSTLARHLGFYYQLPVVSIESLVAGNQAEVTPAVLLDLLKAKLAEAECRNQGVVLDGVPSNAEFADALWGDGPASLPQAFIELEASDSYLRDRARRQPAFAMGLGFADDFEFRLQGYRGANPPDDSHLLWALPTTTRAVGLDASKGASLLQGAIRFVGPPRNFGKDPAVVLAAEQELRRAKAVVPPEAPVAKIRRPMTKDSRREELQLFSKFARSCREWLIESVAAAVAQGLCYILNEMPENPVQMLGCFIGTLLPHDEQEELMAEFREPEEEEEEVGEGA